MRKLFLILAILLLFAVDSFATDVTLQNGVSSYTGNSAVSIRDGSSADTNQNGLGFNVKASTVSGGGFNRVGLMSWSLGSLIPNGATITAVSLRLTYGTASGGASTIKTFKLLRTTFSETSATWNKYVGISSWNTPGAKGNLSDIDGDWTDGVPGNLCTFTVAGTEVIGDTETCTGNATFIAYVQAQIGGSIYLAFHQNQNNDKNFFMRDNEYSTVTDRPLLTISYTGGGGGSNQMHVTVIEGE